MSAIEKCLDVLENFLAENGETSPTIADARAELNAKDNIIKAKSELIYSLLETVNEKDKAVDDLPRIIQKEINWCLDHPDETLSHDAQFGFMNGLRQAQYLLRKASQPAQDDVPPLVDFLLNPEDQ